MGSWRETSALRIGEIIRDRPRIEGESKEQYRQRIYKALHEHYPFAQKSGFAYQCWCEERSRILYTLGIKDKPPKKPFSRNKKKREVQKAALEGQLNLFTPPHSSRARKRRKQDSTPHRI